MLWKNQEGYSDFTAAMAIRNTVRKEKEEKRGMAKRSCRRTKNETAIHEKAVKIRKMTDEQLISYVENRVEKARSEGRNEGKKCGKVKQFFDALMVPGVIPGVGPATVDKFKKIAEEGGFFE
ncbi:hypothetical protein [Lacrimispora sp.]|uniref:hypothetical protein n=1 Tax=Lacrimispora sp. TaxID=2719234 RepID=UPI0028A73CFB|nr:hypothetical protein [Lacrimispora sp.]